MPRFFGSLLNRLAFVCPGGYSLRPALQRWRGVAMGKRVCLGLYVYIDDLHPAALSIGKKTAELTEADLPAIKDVLLKMKANAKLVGEITASQTALATGEVDISVGGGEFVTATSRNPPKRGGGALPQAGRGRPQGMS